MDLTSAGIEPNSAGVMFKNSEGGICANWVSVSVDQSTQLIH